jgi:hypothetical protein
MDNSKYRITFRILHPNLDLSNVFSILSGLEGFEAGDLWIAGRRHINSDGTTAHTASKFSPCLFRFPTKNLQSAAEINITASVEKLISHLETQRDELKRLLRLGLDWIYGLHGD